MRRRERLRLGSEEKINDNESNDHQHDEYAQPRGEDRGSSEDRDTGTGTAEDIYAYAAMYGDARAEDSRGSDTTGVLESQQEERRLDLEEKEKNNDYTKAKRQWKIEHPDQNLKYWKDQYIEGKVDMLPWEQVNYAYKENGEQKSGTAYEQNSEQSENTIWQRLKNDQD